MCGAMHCRPSGCSAAASKLRRALVRKPIHPDAPVGRRMLAQPRNRLRAIAALVAKRIELTLRTSASAHILNRHMISMPRKPHRMRIHHRRSNIAPIRLPHQQRRPRSVTLGIVMIGHQQGSIAEPASNPALQPNSVPAIDQACLRAHRQAPCLGTKLYIATRISAIRAAASFDHRSPFSAVAADGSPSTPLGRNVFRQPCKIRGTILPASATPARSTRAM